MAAEAPGIKLHINTQVEMGQNTKDVIDYIAKAAQESAQNADMSELVQINNVFTLEHLQYVIKENTPGPEDKRDKMLIKHNEYRHVN